MPIKGTIKIDRVLTDMSIAVANESSEYKSTLLAPVIRTPRSTGIFYKYPKGTFFKSVAQAVAPCSPYPELTMTLETDTYKIPVVKSAYRLCEQQVADMDDEVIQAQASAVEQVTHSLLLGRELDFAAQFMTAGAGTPWTTETDVSLGAGVDGQWQTAAADPIKQLRDCICGVKEGGGRLANKAIFGYKAWCCFLDNAAVVSRTAQSGGGPERGMEAQKRAVEAILGLEVEVLSANTANAAGDLQFVNDFSVLVAHVADNPGLRTPSAMYTFAWDYADIGANNTLSMKMIEDEECDSMLIAGKISYQHKKISPDLGCLLYNVCA